MLRRVDTSDEVFVAELLQDDVVRAYLGGPLPAELVPNAVRATTQHEWTLLAEERLCGLRMGLISFDDRAHGLLELSYGFLPEFWGQGYAYEAVSASLQWARSIFGKTELIAVTQAANSRSRRLLDRLGAELLAEFVEFKTPQLSYRLP